MTILPREFETKQTAKNMLVLCLVTVLVGDVLVVIQNWGYRCPEECSLVGCPCCCDTKLGLGVLRNVSLFQKVRNVNYL